MKYTYKERKTNGIQSLNVNTRQPTEKRGGKQKHNSSRIFAQCCRNALNSSV